jgi:RNA polymerase sigma-70 factor (ECF subfamily)
MDDLFGRHHGRLLAFVRARMEPGLSRTVAAEDVVQEVHFEALRKLGEFEDRGPASFYRWLVAIARFKIAEADRARRARKRAGARPLEDEPPAHDTAPSERAMRSEGAGRIHEALEAIGSDQAEAVRLRYLEGLSVAEAAQCMGRTEDALKALVSRGLDALADRLGEAPA